MVFLRINCVICGAPFSVGYSSAKKYQPIYDHMAEEHPEEWKEMQAKSEEQGAT